MSLLEDLEARRPGPDCVGDLELSRLLAGELDPATATRRREHAATCAACGARLADLDADRRAFLAAPPWRLPVPAAPRRRWQWATGAVALAGAAVALFLVMRRPGFDSGRPDGVDGPRGAGTRTKGGLRFDLFVERAGEVSPLGEGDEVLPGDRLQVVYSAEVATHLAVLSRDGSGAVNVYFPPASEMTWPAVPGRGVSLPSSTELDEVLGPETLYMVACPRATPLAALRALAAPAAGAPPDGCTVQSVHLLKRAPP